ncbi:MAG: Crp/Fnr family transcriptional regulator [Hyphomicrobiales bacterium]|nr:Crp/Fnr family transcriptional regulator [Hyphomicrobiales bacterium]
MDAADFAVVRRNMLFRDLDEALARDIVGDRSPRAYAKGQVLFLQGDRVDGLHLVVSGWVKLYRATEDGVDTVVAIHGPGQSFGEAAALLGAPAHAGAEAATEARVLTIDAERVRARLTADPDIAFRMLASASMHLRVMVEELERLKSLPATRRIAGFLVELAGDARGAVELEFPYEKTLIAGRLGMTPESFSRGLAKLREHGVGVERERVSIDRIETLRAVARGDLA